MGARRSDERSDLSDSAAADRQPPFEVCLGDLEQIVRQLEDGQLELNSALQQYERGVALLRRCHQLLAEAERRVEVLTRVDSAPQPTVAPFEESALTLEEKAAQRHRRRSTGDAETASPARRRRKAGESEGGDFGRGDIDDSGQLF